MASNADRGGRGGDGSHKKKRKDLSQQTRTLLKNWLMSPDHFYNPYPSAEVGRGLRATAAAPPPRAASSDHCSHIVIQEKDLLLEQTGIEMKQLTNWFTNARKRIWKPLITSQAIPASKQALLKQAKRQVEQKGLSKQGGRGAAVAADYGGPRKTSGRERRARKAAEAEQLQEEEDEEEEHDEMDDVIGDAGASHDPTGAYRGGVWEGDPAALDTIAVGGGEFLDAEIPWDNLIQNTHASNYWTADEKEDQITLLMESKVDSKSWSQGIPDMDPGAVGLAAGGLLGGALEGGGSSSSALGPGMPLPLPPAPPVSVKRAASEPPVFADQKDHDHGPSCSRRQKTCHLEDGIVTPPEQMGSGMHLESAQWDSNPELKALAAATTQPPGPGREWCGF